jgi:D-psicose/D-tagatose/L-ribulose 3-epimerase
VQEINNPAVRTMFDSHNAEDESEPHGALIEKYFDLIKHVHVNEMDGGHPGTGNYDFVSVFRALIKMKYQRWVSLESFDFQVGAEKIASETITYLRKQEALARQ